MLRHTLIGLILGTSLSFGGLFIDSASANNASDNTGGNLSDITGGNLSDNTGGNLSDNTGGNLSDNTGGKVSDINGKKRYTFTKLGRLNPKIVKDAKQMAADLAEAYKNGSSSNTGRESNNRTAVAEKAKRFMGNIKKQVRRANSNRSRNRMW